jgi:putative hydrolase of the HAD superfamily
VTALRLERWFEPIVYTAALGPGSGKPAVRAFESIEAAWGLSGSSLVYVADNPGKDFAGPRRLGWLAIRLRDPRQLRFEDEARSVEFAPDLEVEAAAGLLEWLLAASTGP